jgi:hypothetical protein
MRSFLLIALAAISVPVFAIEYPIPEQPVAREYLERFKKDVAAFDVPGFLDVPQSAPAWPCNVPEVEQYMLAGLHMAHPELKVEGNKYARKLMREMGQSPQANNTEYKDIRIVPLRAQCEGGKLHGELEMLVYYTSVMTTSSKMMLGDKPTTSKTIITNIVKARRYLKVIQGEMVPDIKHIAEMTLLMETQHDDPRMQEQHNKQQAQAGLGKPTVTKSITYSGEGGLMGSFTLMNQPKVTGGLFGVKVEQIPSITSMFMIPTDARHVRMINYQGAKLTVISHMKDQKPHGEQLIYMDNYLKKNNMRLDQQPGMENAREITMNGESMIERRNCWQDGLMVKTPTCSNE